MAAVAPPEKRRTGDAAAQALDELGDRLAAHVESPYTFRWYLVDDPQVNALAAPGGHVVVFTGLVRATESAEELAGVLAHEMEHVLLRHSLRAIVARLGWRTILSLALGGSGELGGAAARVADQLGALGFSRVQESDVLAKQCRVEPLIEATHENVRQGNDGEQPRGEVRLAQKWG